MDCIGCKQEVTVYTGDENTNSYLPKDEKLAFIINKYNIPFRCSVCGSFLFQYECLRDVVFIYPDQISEKTAGGLIIPDIIRSEMVSEIGTVLSAGPGYYDPKGKYHPTQLKPGDRVIYVKDVPWEKRIYSQDGGLHTVKMMGECDVLALIDDEDCGVE